MDFQKWIEIQMSKQIPEEVVAINFNLYESADDDEGFDAQIVGCPLYDANDPDWACNTIFSSEEDLFHFTSEDWETALEDFEALLRDYLSSAQEKNVLTECQYIAIGFVDGDLIPIRE